MDTDAQFWVIALLLVAVMILLGIVVERLTTLVALFRGYAKSAPSGSLH